MRLGKKSNFEVFGEFEQSSCKKGFFVLILIDFESF